MKTTQTLLLVVVLVVLVGGVTFVRNWLTTPKTGADGPDSKPPLDVIHVPFSISGDQPEQELNAKGFHDFYFQNQSDNAVEVGVETKSCKCAKVEVFLLTPDEQKGFDTQIQSWVDHQGKRSWGSYPAVGQLALLAQKIRTLLTDPSTGRWQLLAPAEQEHEIVRVPAKGTGFFRLTYQNKNPGPLAHGSKIWQQTPGDRQTRNPEAIDLRVPVLVVKPLQIYPDKVSVEELGPNQSYSFESLCWSSTRPGFRLLSIKEENGDPCFVTAVTPLTGEALQKASDILENVAAGKTPLALHVRCAYRINVTVHERLPDSGKQLDLGPLQRKLLLTTDQPDLPTLELAVQGTVRGDVTVGTEKERDMIVLKTFSARKGKEVTVPVESTQPQMELTIDSKKPDYLKVLLKKREDLSSPGRERWDLKVTVPPHSPAGRLEDAYVKLKTDTQRYIRIPVRGNATWSQEGQ